MSIMPTFKPLDMDKTIPFKQSTEKNHLSSWRFKPGATTNSSSTSKFQKEMLVDLKNGLHGLIKPNDFYFQNSLRDTSYLKKNNFLESNTNSYTYRSSTTNSLRSLGTINTIKSQNKAPHKVLAFNHSTKLNNSKLNKETKLSNVKLNQFRDKENQLNKKAALTLLKDSLKLQLTNSNNYSEIESFRNIHNCLTEHSTNTFRDKETIKIKLDKFTFYEPKTSIEVLDLEEQLTSRFATIDDDDVDNSDLIEDDLLVGQEGRIKEINKSRLKLLFSQICFI